jgi:hypothetical protein
MHCADALTSVWNLSFFCWSLRSAVQLFMQLDLRAVMAVTKSMVIVPFLWFQLCSIIGSIQTRFCWFLAAPCWSLRSAVQLFMQLDLRAVMAVTKSMVIVPFLWFQLCSIIGSIQTRFCWFLAAPTVHVTSLDPAAQVSPADSLFSDSSSASDCLTHLTQSHLHFLMHNSWDPVYLLQ